MATIEATLAERGTRYGVYTEHDKIGRILNGDPNYHDSWHDIVGYSKLTADELLPKTSAKKK